MIIPNTKKLIAAFRAAKARVIYITYGSELPDHGDAPVHLKKWLQATHNFAGSPEHEIVADLKPEQGDLVLNKNTMGAFGSTGIDAHLKSMGIRELVMVGVSADDCVGMTAMEASDRQYGVAIVSDATGTCSDEMQEAYLKTWRRLWGRVASTDEVIAEIAVPMRSEAPVDEGRHCFEKVALQWRAAGGGRRGGFCKQGIFAKYLYGRGMSFDALVARTLRALVAVHVGLGAVAARLGIDTRWIPAGHRGAALGRGRLLLLWRAHRLLCPTLLPASVERVLRCSAIPR